MSTCMGVTKRDRIDTMNLLTTCLWCGAEFTPNKIGRASKYCKRSHRQRAYESRKAGMEGVWDTLLYVEDCYLCGLLLDWTDRQSVVFDHEIATVHGGRTNVENLRPVHRVCNHIKLAKLTI